MSRPLCFFPSRCHLFCSRMHKDLTCFPPNMSKLPLLILSLIQNASHLFFSPIPLPFIYLFFFPCRSNGWIRAQNRSSFPWVSSSCKRVAGETGMLRSGEVSQPHSLRAPVKKKKSCGLIHAKCCSRWFKGCASVTLLINPYESWEPSRQKRQRRRNQSCCKSSRNQSNHTFICREQTPHKTLAPTPFALCLITVRSLRLTVATIRNGFFFSSSSFFFVVVLLFAARCQK